MQLTTFDLKKAVRPNIYSLQPYRCARDDYADGILLDANENTHGPSLAEDELKFDLLQRYPDPHQQKLKEALAKLRNIPSHSHFYLGVGSDECIDMAIRVFVEPGKEKILISPPTYGMYAVSAQINNVEVCKVPLLTEGGSFQLNVAKIIDMVTNEPLIKMIIACSPGNPTGTRLSQSDIIEILECPFFSGVLMVDEAYIDFCKDSEGEFASMASLVLVYPNLIISQTLSKAFGLAGIRLGFTISSPEIARIFNNTKAPYNISTPTANIALSALGESGLAVMRRNVESIKCQKEIVMEKVAGLPYVSKLLGRQEGNFILAQIVDQSGQPNNEIAFSIYKHLAEVEKIVVRFRGSEIGCEGCLRITIGTKEENDVLLEKLYSLPVINFYLQ